MKRQIILSLMSFLLATVSFSQKKELKPTFDWGIRYGIHYDYKVLHHNASVIVNFNQHQLTTGPQISQVFLPFWDETDIYRATNIGIHLGYRYSWLRESTNFHPFAQIHFALFETQYTTSQLGPSPLSSQREWILENTVSIGSTYKINPYIQFFGGIGFGSLDSFFLLIDSFVPHICLGIEFDL